jgi:hypothetical protein
MTSWSKWSHNLNDQIHMPWSQVHNFKRHENNTQMLMLNYWPTFCCTRMRRVNGSTLKTLKTCLMEICKYFYHLHFVWYLSRRFLPMKWCHLGNEFWRVGKLKKLQFTQTCFHIWFNEHWRSFSSFVAPSGFHMFSFNSWTFSLQCLTSHA